MVYHTKMLNVNEVALPLVNKVIKGKLVLQDYTLDSGHCRALASSIKQTAKPQIDALLLENCGIDDYELSLLLEGLLVMDNFEKFVYKNNVFLDNSLRALKPILTRPSHKNLQCLRLVNCETTPQIMEELLEFMLSEGVRLKTVGFV